MNWRKAKELLKEGKPLIRRCWGEGIYMYLEDGYKIRFKVESNLLESGWTNTPEEWRLIRPYLHLDWELFEND